MLFPELLSVLLLVDEDETVEFEEFEGVLDGDEVSLLKAKYKLSKGV